MKKIFTILALSAALAGPALRAQSYCDSLTLTNTYVDTQGQTVSFDFHYSGSYMMVYPVLSLVLNPNPYLSGGNSVNSFINPASFNNGNTTLVVYCGNFTPASQVPLNTVFTGTLTITDPNDSNTVCVYAISFTYGTMLTSGIVGMDQFPGLQLFPNPASDLAVLETGGEALAVQPVLEITDLAGRKMHAVAVTSERTEIPLTELPAGVYFCTLTSGASRLAVWKLAVSR